MPSTVLVQQLASSCSVALRITCFSLICGPGKKSTRSYHKRSVSPTLWAFYDRPGRTSWGELPGCGAASAYRRPGQHGRGGWGGGSSGTSFRSAARGAGTPRRRGQQQRRQDHRGTHGEVRGDERTGERTWGQNSDVDASTWLKTALEWAQG